MTKVTRPNHREAEMLAVLMNGELYGRQVRDRYEERTGQKMPLGSLYVTLDRMEEKGFVRSRDGDPDPERGGNRRKFFRLTASGTRALNDLQQWAATLME